MKVKIFWIFAILGVVRTEPPSTSYGTPIAAPINNYGAPNYDNGNYHDYDNHKGGGGHDYHGDHGDHGDQGEPQAYEFGYQVKDDYTGTNYNRKEASDGNQVRGEYRVQLPDGRTQIVTYYADWQTGFHADVRYEGTAHYPEQYNNHNGQYGAPSYSNNGYSGGNPAANSVSIANSNGHNSYNNYDSYSGNYKGRPGYEYGAP